MHLKKASGLCNSETNYDFEKGLPDFVIRNILEGYFWKYKNLWR